MAIHQVQKRTGQTKNGRLFYRILKSSEFRQVDLFGLSVEPTSQNKKKGGK